MDNRSTFFLKSISIIETILNDKIGEHLTSNQIDISKYDNPFLAGGFLLNLILNYVGHPVSYYKDIDIFYFQDEIEEYPRDFYSDLMKDHDFLIHSYYKKNTNFIKIMDARIKYSSCFINYFDLNCVRIAYDIKAKKIFFDEHFLFFLDTLEILNLKYDNFSYFDSHDRAVHKKEKLGLFFNATKNEDNFSVFLKAQNIHSLDSIMFLNPKTIIEQNEFKNKLLLKNSNNKKIEIHKNISLEEDFLTQLLKKPEVISYLVYLNKNQTKNLIKFCQKVNYSLKCESIIKIIQQNKKFFSKNISEVKWCKIEIFFNIDMPLIVFVQDLLMRSLGEISLDQFSSSINLFLKYKEYLDVFDDREIVNFIYEDPNKMGSFAAKKIQDYTDKLNKKLALPINYKAYNTNINMVTSIEEVRKIGLKFKNCIIDHEFSVINSFNTRIFHIKDDDGESLVRFINCNNIWTTKDFESPSKNKPPVTHIYFVEKLLIELNQIEISKVPI